MPNGAFLYADELLGALVNKSAANGFRDMVLYIEACESGSIFEVRFWSLPRCSRMLSSCAMMRYYVAVWRCAAQAARSHEEYAARCSA